MRPLFGLCQTLSMRKLVWLFALCALGCAAKNPFVGSWDSEVTLMGNKIPLLNTFGENGVYSGSFEVAGTKAKLAGTYKYEKERLSIVIAKLDLDTSGSFLPPSMIEEGRASVEKEMKQPLEGKVSWTSDSLFTVQPDRSGVPILSFKKRPS